MFKNIIFDWSGVVKDNTLDQLEVVNKIFIKFGAEAISLEEFKENWVQPYMLFYNKYLPDISREEEQDAFRKFVLECPKSNPYGGIVDLIKKLKESGAMISVVSSDVPETLIQEIEEFGLSGFFDNVVYDVHDKTKGAREIVAKNNHKKEEAVFIGDSNHEIEAGKDIGIKTIAVTWGFSTEEKLKALDPDYLVHNIKELEEILLND